MTITTGTDTDRDARAGDVIDGEVIDSTTAERRELQPILASWLKDRGEFTEKVTDASRRAAHTTTFHTVHSPLHILRILKYAPRGGWRVGKSVFGWVMDWEGKPLRQNAVYKDDSPEWRALCKEREKRIHRRWIGLAVMTVLCLISLALAWVLFPPWAITSWFTLTPGWSFTVAAFAGVRCPGLCGSPVG